MQAELIKTFRFEAAHSLTAVPEGHKCRQLHGHSYRVDLHITGPINEQGWVIDFGEIKRIAEPLIDRLDHSLLNEIPGLENSTSEMLAVYLWNRIKPAIPLLTAVTIWESDTSRCTYQGK